MVTPATQLRQHVLFWPIVIAVLVAWVIYRQLFHFPVWFDETIAKAFFFGLPVWIYVIASRFTPIVDTFSREKLERGLLLGLALGGVYGFVTAIISILQKGAVVAAVPLFMSDRFWFEFVLALFTSFWESLFFFSFVGMVIFDKYKHWSLVTQILLISGVFLAFHLPNIILRFSGAGVPSMVFMLALFGLGQALLLYEYRNGYALVISQAIWGMVLLVHGG